MLQQHSHLSILVSILFWSVVPRSTTGFTIQSELLCSSCCIPTTNKHTLCDGLSPVEAYRKTLRPTSASNDRGFSQELSFNKHIDDPLWEQIKMEAMTSLQTNPEAGPLLYTSILSQPSLIVAIVSSISNEIATELISAVALKNLFLDCLTKDDTKSIAYDLVAASTRSSSLENAMTTVMFHQGFHALVCYRLGHRLWQAGRTGLAYYMQSTVSRKYSADIHPAAKMGTGIHLRATAGVVIGETAVVGNDVSILEGVTLGGTGKETGDRHPKIRNGVTIYHGASILGNIVVGEGAVIRARSIVTKPVPDLAIMSGVPARIQSYRELTSEEFNSDLQEHLADKYLNKWKKIVEESKRAESTP